MASTSESQTTVQAGGLTPVLSTRFALRAEHAGQCLLLVVVFLVLSYTTLPTGELWNHVIVGDWILATRQLPTQAIATPLAEGIPTVDTAWLSQVLLAWTHRAGGPAALSALYTLVTFGSLLALTVVYYRQTGRKRLALIGLAITLLLGWGSLSQLLPTTFGFLCLVGLLGCLVSATAWQSLPKLNQADSSRTATAESLPRALWFAIPLLLALWANLHSSFIVGLAVLFAWSVGGLCDVARCRGLRAALQTPIARQRIYLAELALAATLINPLGIDLWLATFGLAPIRLGSAGTGAAPLILASAVGVMLAAVCLLAAALLRLSPRPLSVAEILIFVLGVAASAYNIHNLPWFAPLAAVVLLPHLAAAWGLERRPAIEPESQPVEGDAAPAKPLQFAFTLICLLLVWIGFALSPLATPVLGGKPRTLAQWHNSQTPLGVAGYLATRETSPRLLWTAPDWADYLSHRSGAPIFAGSTAAALPAQVQFDHFQLSSGENWERIADRYAIDLLVIDKARHGRLLTVGRRAESNSWRIAFEDKQALVLERILSGQPHETEPVQPPQSAATSRAARRAS